MKRNEALQLYYDLMSLASDLGDAGMVQDEAQTVATAGNVRKRYDLTEAEIRTGNAEQFGANPLKIQAVLNT